MNNLEAKEEVNHSKRQRRYGAQDKEELIFTITKLHEGDIKLNRKFEVFSSLMR